MAHRILDNCIGCQACSKRCPVAAINGSNKAIHKVDDTICIDCGVCGKVCPVGAVVDNLGKISERVKPDQWKKPNFNYGVCVSCRACDYACPVGCLSMEQNNSEIRPLPMLKKTESCISCSFCERACPVEAITMVSSIG